MSTHHKPVGRVPRSGPGDGERVTPGGSGGPDLSRRDALRIAAGSVVAANLATLRAAAAEPSLRFFTAEEFALADALCELLIPADEHSPGARAAGAARFIDAALAESFTDEPRTVWRQGLGLVDAMAVGQHRVRFVELPAAQQTALLQRLSAHEGNPATDEDRFFVELKRRTVHAYYTSRIGIHDELEYKGNTMLGEFVGIDVSREKR